MWISERIIPPSRIRIKIQITKYGENRTTNSGYIWEYRWIKNKPSWLCILPQAKVFELRRTVWKMARFNRIGAYKRRLQKSRWFQFLYEMQIVFTWKLHRYCRRFEWWVAFVYFAIVGIFALLRCCCCRRLCCLFSFVSITCIILLTYDFNLVSYVKPPIRPTMLANLKQSLHLIAVAWNQLNLVHAMVG